MKQKEIKELVRTGKAIDITTADISKLEKLEKLSLSFGVYGMNGGLYQGKETGKIYAITSRSGNLFAI